jgi:hypothetical protein
VQVLLQGNFRTTGGGINMRKLILTFFFTAITIYLLTTSAHAIYISADYNSYDGSKYLYDVNIHDLVVNPANPVSAYDLDATYNANTFAKIVFSGALGESAELSSTGNTFDTSIFSLAVLNIDTPGLIDFEGLSYYSDAAALYAAQNNFITGNVLTLATLYFDSNIDPNLVFTNRDFGESEPPDTNDILLLDNSVLY